MSGEVPCYFAPATCRVRPGDGWRAGSVFSRSGRKRSGGSTGGADRVLVRELEVFACDFHVQQFKRGKLNQEAMSV